MALLYQSHNLCADQAWSEEELETQDCGQGNDMDRKECKTDQHSKITHDLPKLDQQILGPLFMKISVNTVSHLYLCSSMSVCIDDRLAVVKDLVMWWLRACLTHIYEFTHYLCMKTGREGHLSVCLCIYQSI